MKLQETLALAERIATGATSASPRELGMANALLTLETALGSCRANDRSQLYAPGEARRDGQRPASDASGAGRWLTPRETAELLLIAHPDTPPAPSDAGTAAIAVETSRGHEAAAAPDAIRGDATPQPGETP